MRKSLLIVVLAILTAVLSTWAPGAVAIGVVLVGALALGTAGLALLAGFNLLTGRVHQAQQQRHA